MTTLRVAARAVEEALLAIRDTGTQQGLLRRMQTRQELYELIGYGEYEQFDREISRWRAGS